MSSPSGQDTFPDNLSGDTVDVKIELDLEYVKVTSDTADETWSYTGGKWDYWDIVAGWLQETRGGFHLSETRRKTILHLSTAMKQLQELKQLLTHNKCTKNRVVGAKGFTGTLAIGMEQRHADTGEAPAAEDHETESASKVKDHFYSLRNNNEQVASDLYRKDDGIILAVKSLVQTLYILLVGIPYATMANFSNIFGQEIIDNHKIFKVADAIRNPLLLPLSFHFIALLTASFALGLVMTLATIWSLDRRYWSSFSRAVLLFIVGCTFLTYALMVWKFVPHFHISIAGSNPISSMVAMCLYVIALIGIFYAAWLLAKMARVVFFKGNVMEVRPIGPTSNI